MLTAFNIDLISINWTLININSMKIKKHSHLRQILAVGIVTQTGAYFFLASGVPRLGSSDSAIATFAMEQAAAAAAANTSSLLPLLLLSSLFLNSMLTFSAFDDAALATAMRPPLFALVAAGFLAMLVGSIEAAAMVIEAMFAADFVASDFSVDTKWVN